MRKWSEMVMKKAKFSRIDYSFSLETLVKSLAWQMNWYLVPTEYMNEYT